MKQRVEAEVLPLFSSRRLTPVQALMRHLYAQPVIDVKRPAQVTKSTVNTGSALIRDLVAHNVLSELTGRRRNRLSVFHEYLNLFIS